MQKRKLGKSGTGSIGDRTGLHGVEFRLRPGNRERTGDQLIRAAYEGGVTSSIQRRPMAHF